MITIDEAVALTGKTRSSIQKYYVEGKVPSYKIKNRVYLKKEELLEFFNNRNDKVGRPKGAKNIIWEEDEDFTSVASENTVLSFVKMFRKKYSKQDIFKELNIQSNMVELADMYYTRLQNRVDVYIWPFHIENINNSGSLYDASLNLKQMYYYEKQCNRKNMQNIAISSWQH